MKRFRLFIGLAALVVLVGLSAASCQRPAPPTNDQNDQADNGDQSDELPSDEVTDPTPPIDGGVDNTPFGGLADPAAAKLAMEKELTDATATIAGLKDDLVLQLVSMKFVNSLSDQTGLTTNYYIFSSPSDTRYYYLVNIPHNGESMKRFLMPKEDLALPFDLIPVQKQYWQLSYVDALRAVENQGGSAFRGQHSKYEVSAILAKPAGQFLNWFITYRATDGSGEVFQASVDSNTGELKIEQ